MKRIPSLVLISFLFLNACNESSRTAENKNTDTSTTTVAKNDTSFNPVYDPAIDPLLVGAAFTKKLADTLGIKMFELTLKPGDSLPMHSHPDHAGYLMDTSTGVLYVPGQNKADTGSGLPGTGWIHGPFTDAAKNIGKTTIRLLEVAVHRPRGVEMPKSPAYDSTIDAFTMGGKSIQKLGDTLGIKMFIVTMKPGDTATLHSHPDHTVYVLEGGELAVTLQGGARQIMKLEKGMGLVGGPLSDAAKNTGKTTIKLLMTHIYRPRAN
jgi:quercetin dioxygenase-like cupin family protein